MNPAVMQDLAMVAASVVCALLVMFSVVFLVTWAAGELHDSAARRWNRKRKRDEADRLLSRLGGSSGGGE